MSPGTRLFTRDGRRIGNAVVTGPGPVLPLREPKPTVHIETDFGNVATLTHGEVRHFFYVDGADPETPGADPDLAGWYADRDMLRQREPEGRS